MRDFRFAFLLYCVGYVGAVFGQQQPIVVVEPQSFRGTLENKDYPMTTIAYFRVYWRFIEPQEGVYRWDIIDKAFQTAHATHQSLSAQGSVPEQ